MLLDGAVNVFFHMRLPLLLSARLIVHTWYGLTVPLSDKTPGAIDGVVPNSISPGSTYCIVGFCVDRLPVKSAVMVTFHEYAVLQLMFFPIGLNCNALVPLPGNPKAAVGALVQFHSASQPDFAVVL
jgi:hypothetical protein